MWTLQEYLSKQDQEMNTLRQIVNEKDEESKKRQSMLEAKLKEMEQMRSNLGGWLVIYTYLCTYMSCFAFAKATYSLNIKFNLAQML